MIIIIILIIINNNNSNNNNNNFNNNNNDNNTNDDIINVYTAHSDCLISHNVDKGICMLSASFSQHYVFFFQTALASIPGSGNTWTRHLIEELTG